MTAVRRSQVERRQLSRDALLEAGARHLSRYGYGSLSLARLAQEAGFTRGALYHQFPGKDAFVLAVVEWVETRWYDEVLGRLPADLDARSALVWIARTHAVFCRRDIARVAITLRTEFAGRDDHPVGRAVAASTARVIADCTELVEQGRSAGAISTGGPPSDLLAAAIVHAVEGVVAGIGGADGAPHDVEMAAAVVRGLLDVAADTDHQRDG